MKKIVLSQVGEVLQKMYDSNISLSMAALCDLGFTYVATHERCQLQCPEEFPEELDVRKVEDMLTVLCYTISVDLPKNEFTEWYLQL